MQGVGNDFVMVDGRAYRGLDWPRLAVEMCHRKLGVGADGLLVVEESTEAEASMRMFNPDGTEDVCGNGLRCVARFVAERGWGEGEKGSLLLPASRLTTHDSRLSISTLAGVRRATVHPDGTVTVDMGPPRFAPEEIPIVAPGPRVVDYPIGVAGEVLTVTALSTGTTHTVLLVDALPEDDRFFRLSPLIEHHPLFPERTSIMWTQVTGPDALRLRIWERGAGETWGCGTGACAAAVAAILHGLVRSSVTVTSRGGELRVEWREGETILQTGPAEYVYEGTYPLRGSSP